MCLVLRLCSEVEGELSYHCGPGLLSYCMLPTGRCVKSGPSTWTVRTLTGYVPDPIELLREAG